MSGTKRFLSLLLVLTMIFSMTVSVYADGENADSGNTVSEAAVTEEEAAETEEPDPETFAGLKLALEAARIGGSMPTVFNAANEYAVARFLERRIGFTGIYDVIESCMQQHQVVSDPDAGTILEIQEKVRLAVESGWPD